MNSPTSAGSKRGGLSSLSCSRFRALSIPRTSDDGMLRVDHRERAMQQVRSGERLGRQVRGLHELEGAFPGSGVGVAAARGDQAVHEAIMAGNLIDGFICEDLRSPGGEACSFL